MDIVYVVRHAEDNEELRYSLRSLANLPHDRVWIAGYKPTWVSGVGEIPTVQSGSKWENSTGNLLAACLHPDVSERFVLFNDDFFVMHPIDAVPVLHRGPVSEVAAAYARNGESHYLTGMLETAALLRRLGHPDPLSYELHVPMTLDKARCAEVLGIPGQMGMRLRVLHKRTLYGNVEAVGGAETHDVKVPYPASEWSPEWTFLSTHESTFTAGTVGGYIRSRFPDPSPYECEEADMADDKTSTTGLWLDADGKVVKSQPRGGATQLVRPGGQITAAAQARIDAAGAPTDAPAVSASEALNGPVEAPMEAAVTTDDIETAADTKPAKRTAKRTAKKS
jgi:hypothetical protein